MHHISQKYYASLPSSIILQSHGLSSLTKEKWSINSYVELGMMEPYVARGGKSMLAEIKNAAPGQ